LRLEDDRLYCTASFVKLHKSLKRRSLKKDNKKKNFFFWLWGGVALLIKAGYVRRKKGRAWSVAGLGVTEVVGMLLGGKERLDAGGADD
jgi:hypothetical protein